MNEMLGLLGMIFQLERTAAYGSARQRDICYLVVGQNHATPDSISWRSHY